jgi:hypothetical protein
VVAALAIAGTLTASAAPPGAGQPANVVPLAPARILDTRTGVGAPQARVGAGQTITLKVAGAGGVPADATGVILNLTVAAPSEGSFVTAWPTGEPRPNASVINFQGGWDIANMVTATLGTNGSIDLYNDRGDVDLIADVAGYLAPASAGGGAKAIVTQLPSPGGVAAIGTFGTTTVTLTCEPAVAKMLLIPPTGKQVSVIGNPTNITSSTAADGTLTLASAAALGSAHGVLIPSAEPGVFYEIDVQLVRIAGGCLYSLIATKATV